MGMKTSELLDEMQSIFGDSFGRRESLVESEQLDEGPGLRQGKRRKPEPSPKGLLKKGRGGRRDPRKVMKIAAAAAAKNPDNPKKQKKDKKRFRKLMKGAQGALAKKDKEKSASAPGGGEGRGEETRASRGLGGKKSARRHFPFKRSANLGPGPRGRHHDETKCWQCKCGNVYSDGCTCRSTGKGENCPEKGTIKKISYKKDYKRSYNDEYHKWRAKQGGRVTQRLGSTRTAL